MEQSGAVLVTGATGAQGGAVIDALLEAGRPVHALVRDPESESALGLAERGVRLHRGDFDDKDALRAAVSCAEAVFSMQMPPHPKDPDRERRAADHLITAAVDAGVRTVVHTSVARADEHEQFAGWNENRWWPLYWTSKAAANDLVRSSSLPHRIILKPAFMMDNFMPPKVAMMFATLANGEITTAMDPETRLDLIAAADIGKVAAEVFADPVRFDGREIPLAGESLTMTEVAAVLSDITGSAVKARHLSAADAVAAGSPAGVVQNQQWLNVEGYRVDRSIAAQWGFGLQTFTGWAAEHRSRLVIGNH
ncbi:NmrA family NAD(P)-binding protein [Nocardia sp. NPDC005366]|uniref:NmrA family NAD(P)-binding protein n=1 Tax=Nocardia sp. NPDC005366 TaxID=3156878 RepID=UPI0033AED260